MKKTLALPDRLAPTDRGEISIPRFAGTAWAGRLDLAQSLSGLILGLFMWCHMLFVATILFSEDTFWTVARAFEGYFILGRPQPWLVSLAVGGIFGLFVLHAFLALRKFPGNAKQYRTFWDLARHLRHPDTALWLTQVLTGFALFFLGSAHLYTMLANPSLIGPYESADRVWSGHFWPLYLVLLFVVEIHGGIGLYRLAVKWGGLPGADPGRTRRRLIRLRQGLTVFFLALGLASLAAFVRIGMEHAPRAGEPYTPSWIDAARQP